MAYENTHMWLTTLAVQPEGEGDASSGPRERLRAAFLSFRERAQVLAAEIPRDMPEFTVHDISHIDALWEMADLLAGAEYHLTPTEAFVLGGAFLIHDIGMSLAAYPRGIAALHDHDGWKDTLASHLHSELGRPPTDEEIDNPPAEVERLAVAEMLRNLHAQRAGELALTSWALGNGERFHLIETPEIRQELGPIIGRIAHSHWWSTDRLRDEFPTALGAPAGYPQSWTVDPLKLACLLRIADVTHLDARRAPKFLRALRQPQDISEEHWVFQGHLHQPLLREDRLVYTSGHSFTVEEAPAWWQCFDALKGVDRELRQVDALLADAAHPRLVASSVAGVEDPERLLPFVPTQGWTPVDARIKVGDVAQLVERLGGEELYGREATVPLRELIQNASDAVRARRMFEGRSSTWGEIVVRLGEDADGYWLEVEDNGIGMSASVLTEALLDFGASYWGSSLMRRELPGLLSSAFRPTGKYGIGFFSVFMWGHRVRVTTRRPEVARERTLVLEFQTGLRTRPILRNAAREELILDGGTRVRVWLSHRPSEDGGLLYKASDDDVWTLADLCAWLAPALDVNLYVVQETQERELVITGGDWLTIEPEELCARIRGPRTVSEKDGKRIDADILKAEQNMRIVEDENGAIVGRAFVRNTAYRWYGSYRGRARLEQDDDVFGVVVVGGLRSTALENVEGILIGEPVRAARDKAVPIVSLGALAEWASEQATLFYQAVEELEARLEVAQAVRVMGGNTGPLPVAQTASEWATFANIACQEQPDEVVLVFRASVEIAEREHGGDAILAPHVFSTEVGTFDILRHGQYDHWIVWPPGRPLANGEPWFHRRSLAGLVIEALAKAWGSSLEDVLDASDMSTDEKSIEREIGTIDGETIIDDHVYVIRNPNKES